MSLPSRSVLLFSTCLLLLSADALSLAENQSPAARGFRALRTHPFLPPDFDEEVLGKLWTT